VIMLLVDELMDELLTPVTPDELTIEISLDLTSQEVYADRDEFAEVA
jgi:hypothetical protein